MKYKDVVEKDAKKLQEADQIEIRFWWQMEITEKLAVRRDGTSC